MSLVVLLLLPLIAAAICVLPLGRRVPPIVTLCASAAVLAVSLRTAVVVASGRSLVVWPGWLAFDGLSALMLALIAGVGALAALFSAGYLPASTELRRLRFYHASFNLFMFSILAIPLVSEPTLVWIMVELTTVFSALLVCFENSRAALEAAWKYVVLSLMGAAIALLGILMLFAALQVGGGGDFTWRGLVEAAPRMPHAVLVMAFLLILVGLGTKVGLVPMHTWLPDAHSQAPSPVCALLSGVETTAILYVILRLVPIVNGVGTIQAQTWLVLFGLVSVGTAAFLLLQVSDFKRMFAFSTVEHMGIILLASGFGTSAALYAALYQALCHAVTKSFCFFAAGTALFATDSSEIAGVRGLIRTSPAAGASLLVGGLAIAGAPPFAVFLSEFSILRSGLASGHYVATALLVAFVAVGFFGILSHVNGMVFGAEPAHPPARRRIPPACLATLCVSGSLVVVLGLYMPANVHDLLRIAAKTLER